MDWCGADGAALSTYHVGPNGKRLSKEAKYPVELWYAERLMEQGPYTFLLLYVGENRV